MENHLQKFQPNLTHIIKDMNENIIKDMNENIIKDMNENIIKDMNENINKNETTKKYYVLNVSLPCNYHA